MLFWCIARKHDVWLVVGRVENDIAFLTTTHRALYIIALYILLSACAELLVHLGKDRWQLPDVRLSLLFFAYLKALSPKGFIVLVKTKIAVAIISTLCFLCAASSPAVAKDPQDIRIAFVVPALSNPWFMGVKSGVDAACKELGIQCTTIDAQNNARKQQDDVRDVIDDDYDGIFASALDSRALAPLYARAQRQGMVTASIAQTVMNSDLFYTMDEHDYGYTIGSQAAHWAQENLGGKGKALVFTQDNMPEVKARGDGVMQALHDICPELEVVERYTADDPYRAMILASLVLPRNPDLNMVVATTDSAGIGGYITMFANSMLGKDFGVFSGDATRDVLIIMNEPDSIYRGTVDLNPYKGGYESIQIMYDMIQNGTPIMPMVRRMSYNQVSQEMVTSGQFKPSY